MDQNLFNYNDEDIDSVIEYSHKLLNRKFSDVMEEYNRSLYKSYDDYNDRVVSEVQDKAISMKSKGQYGNYIEKYFYGYQPNSDSEADFEKIGVELKVTPFKINKNGTLSAKERLVLTILNYMEENLEDFYSTHLWKKCAKILLLFYNGLIPNQTMKDYVIEKYFYMNGLRRIWQSSLKTIRRLQIRSKMEGHMNYQNQMETIYQLVQKGQVKERI